MLWKKGKTNEILSPEKKEECFMPSEKTRVSPDPSESLRQALHRAWDEKDTPRLLHLSRMLDALQCRLCSQEQEKKITA